MILLSQFLFGQLLFQFFFIVDTGFVECFLCLSGTGPFDRELKWDPFVFSGLLIFAHISI